MPAKKGTPGAAVTFTMTLHNDTATEQTFTLSVPDAPDGWTVTAAPPEAQADELQGRGGRHVTDLGLCHVSDRRDRRRSTRSRSSPDAGNNVGATGQLGVELARQQAVSLNSTTGVLNITANAGSPTNYAVQVVNTRVGRPHEREPHEHATDQVEGHLHAGDHRLARRHGSSPMYRSDPAGRRRGRG